MAEKGRIRQDPRAGRTTVSPKRVDSSTLPVAAQEDPSARLVTPCKRGLEVLQEKAILVLTFSSLTSRTSVV